MNAIFKSVLMAAALACLSPTIVVADDPPQMVVEFLMNPLPEALGLQDPQSESALKIAGELRGEAAKLLNRVFPFIQWIPAESPPETDPVGWLTFVMKAEPGIAQRVYIEASVRKSAGDAEKTLGIVARDVYPDSRGYLPPPTEVETHTLANAKSVLEEMINGKSAEWQEQLTRKIPVSQRVVATENLPTALVVPLKAKRLKAKSDSVLLVQFFGKVDDEPQKKGEIELHPVQQIYEPDSEYFEMQVCEVKRYHYLPINVDGWHAHILVALANLAPMTNLKVFMIDYKREDENPIDDQF